MQLNSDDTFLMAKISECPRIDAAMQEYLAEAKRVGAWLDKVREAWGVPKFDKYRTLNEDGFVETVKVRGLQIFYPTQDLADAACDSLAKAALAYDRWKLAKDEGYSVRPGLRSKAQKQAAALAKEHNIRGTDCTRSNITFLAKHLGGEGMTLDTWLHPGIIRRGDTICFNASSETASAWPKQRQGWIDALLRNGAVLVPMSKAAELLESDANEKAA